jgi:hypothetical protein
VALVKPVTARVDVAALRSPPCLVEAPNENVALAPVYTSYAAILTLLEKPLQETVNPPADTADVDTVPLVGATSSRVVTSADRGGEALQVPAASFARTYA